MGRGIEPIPGADGWRQGTHLLPAHCRVWRYLQMLQLQYLNALKMSWHVSLVQEHLTCFIRTATWTKILSSLDQSPTDWAAAKPMSFTNNLKTFLIININNNHEQWLWCLLWCHRPHQRNSDFKVITFNLVHVYMYAWEEEGRLKAEKDAIIFLCHPVNTSSLFSHVEQSQRIKIIHCYIQIYKTIGMEWALPEGTWQQNM